MFMQQQVMALLAQTAEQEQTIQKLKLKAQEAKAASEQRKGRMSLPGQHTPGVQAVHTPQMQRISSAKPSSARRYSLLSTSWESAASCMRTFGKQQAWSKVLDSLNGYMAQN